MDYKRILITLFLTILFSIGILNILPVSESPSKAPEAISVSSVEQESVVQSEADVILYQIKDHVLEYNVSHTAVITEDTVINGSGIDTAEELNGLLGTADHPAEVFGTDTAGRTLKNVVRADIILDENGNIKEITVTEISERPVIGISWKQDEIKEDYVSFAEALERAGAVAVFLPQLKNEEDAERILSEVDGVFGTGGYGWNPELFQERQTPHGTTYWSDDRDTSDIALFKKAVELDVPLLCVCRSTQGLNIALGGKLIQDIPYYLGQKVLTGEIDVERVTKVLSGTLPGSSETVPDEGYYYYDETGFVAKTYDDVTDQYMSDSDCEEGHLRVQVDGIDHSNKTGYHALEAGYDGIGISKDSKWLYELIGSDHIDLVASAHHMAVDPENLGEGVTIAAISSDGIVEAIEVKSNTFVLGLQWHPERDALRDTRGSGVDLDLCRAPLVALVKYAEKNHEKKTKSE